MWDAIAITCKRNYLKATIKKELTFMLRKNVFDKNSIFILEDDPHKYVGSGGATLNALLRIAEYLSAVQNYSVINHDVLINKKILIIHYAREFPYDILGRAMVSLPFEVDNCGYRHLYTNLLNVVKQITNINRTAIKSGVWVASTDMYFSCNEVVDTELLNSDVTIFTCLKNKALCKNHGIIKIVDDKPQDLFYQGSSEDIQQCLNSDGLAPVILGLVYFSIKSSLRLLELIVEPPLDGCTYIGVDSGAPPLYLGLLLDIVACILPGPPNSDNDFEQLAKRGQHWHNLQASSNLSSTSKASENTDSENYQRYSAALRRLRLALSNLTANVVVMKGNSCAFPSMSLTASEFLNNMFSIKDSGVAVPGVSASNVANSFVVNQTTIPDNTMICNSLINAAQLELSGRSLIMHCELSSIHLNLRDVCLIGLNADLCKQFMEFPVDIQLVAYRVELSLLAATPAPTVVVPCTWGRFDDLAIPSWKGVATIFNEPWVVFLERTGISREELWSPSMASNSMTLMSARLFPVVGLEVKDVSRVFRWFWNAGTDADGAEILELWRKSWRYSLEEILAHCNPAAEMDWRLELCKKVSIRRVRDVLENRKDVGLRGYFRTSVAEGWSVELLGELDALIADVLHDAGLTARCLACIGDLLGCMANDVGGLRSGPAANLRWQPAYALLEDGKLSDGITLMKKLREEWMSEPELLIRAARHYEGASQMLIRRAVLTCRQPLPPVCCTNRPRLVVAEAPARLDLAGGWSDTPPICYENGGCVVNMAVLVNGERPIGAQVKVMDDAEGIKLVLSEGPPGATENKQEDVSISITHLDAIRDYNKPHAPGNLLKAALVFSELLNLSAAAPDLGTQLQASFGEECRGIEMHAWSRLPSGSGLGTSSILAACVLAALWRLAGLEVGDEALLTGVLVVEQLMTTGGGWQDQVGGVLGGGLKVGRSSAGLPLHLTASQIKPPPGFLPDLSDRLVLIYTGKTRLARNLLQEVIRNWYARNSSVTDTVRALVANAEKCVEAITDGDLMQLGDCVSAYWKQKKVMVGAASEPADVADLLTAIRPFVSCAALAGAGGGGFLFGLLRVAGKTEALCRALAGFNSTHARCAELYDVELDCQGLVITTDID